MSSIMCVNELPKNHYLIMCKGCKVMFAFTTNDLIYSCMGFYTLPPCRVCKTTNTIDGEDI